MGRSLNYERAAMVLCDAMVLGDRRTAEKWDIGLRTVQGYRQRLQNDAKLRKIAQEYREKQTENWLKDLPVALSAIIEFMKRSSQELSPSNPEHLHEVINALSALHDVELSQKVIGERLKNRG